MYFPCCLSKSVSQETLHDNDGIISESRRRPNPIIVGLANHLREHHSSSRNSAMAGCFGFPDSPPKYEDIYVSTKDSTVSRHQSEGICNLGATNTIMDDETMSSSEDLDELPPPSYKESVEMSSEFSRCVVVTIAVEQSSHDRGSDTSSTYS